MPQRQTTPRSRPMALVMASLGGLIVLVGGGCCYDCGSCAQQELPALCQHPIRSDYGNFYTGKTLAVSAAALAGGSIMANTEIDQHLRDWYQGDVRSGKIDGMANVATHFGDGRFVLPALGLTLLAGELFDERPCASTMGDWADLSLRGLAVGVPPLLTAQLVTGGSRPGESSAGSDWIPFHDDNGVSGHAFIGAVPFITAANMTDDPLAKAGFFAVSALPGWSRINDDDHYTSQVLLGWTLAYLSCSAVNQTERERNDCQFTTVPIPGGVGVGVVFNR